MSKKKRILFSVLIVTILISALCVNWFRKSLRPTVVSMAENYATREATYKINECVADTLSGEENIYKNFVAFSEDADGKVRILTADSAKTNALKAELSTSLVNALGSIKGQTFAIPLGNVINGNLFAGRGPDLNVKILSVGAVTTDFRSEFEEAAINQTLHRIMLDVSVNVSVYVPFDLRDVTVKGSVCIAETVLVGEVPDAYTFVVENGDGIAGEINDYGADNFLK